MQSDRDTHLAREVNEALAALNNAMEGARSEGIAIEFKFNGTWREFSKIPLRYVRVVKADKPAPLAEAA